MATSSTNLNLVSSSLAEPLPLDIILAILNFALSSNPGYHAIAQLSLLSKAVYQWMLPHLYHTLDLGDRDVTCIKRSLLLNSAKASSFLFTRRIISHIIATPFNFSPFAQLTHLILWGPHRFDVEPDGLNSAREIVMLPLEELSVWESGENDALLHHLTANVTIWRTLQRFSTFLDGRIPRPDEGWLQCPNLTQVLVLCYVYGSFIHSSITDVILPSPRFQSYIIAPGVSWSMNAAIMDELTPLMKDPRFVILCECPQHLRMSSGSFWDDQSDMWAVVRNEKRKNLDAKEATVIDKIPWDAVKGCYIVS
ncbi:hypothetical protein DL96DRAFT_1627093 [Flagelloscypha sp. PMI_526]|nr:hypothetical protein DL96DRAFT_1627093 [Flagelloscypha sp. PMI_526]